MTSDSSNATTAEASPRRPGRAPSAALRHDQATDDRLAQVERLRLLGELAGGIAHDFNNILTIILGYADLIETEVPADGAVAHALGEMRKAGLRGAGLTRQLLTVRRSAAGRRECVDVGLLVRNMERVLRQILLDHVSLLISAPKPAYVLADPGQIEQLVIEVVLNARDAIVARGDVRISVDAGPEQVRVTIADNGRGMDAVALARAFDPFYTTRPGGRGTGLGLPTVESIVEAHGGTVRIESTVGSGTTVDARLPRCEPPEGAARA